LVIFNEYKEFIGIISLGEIIEEIIKKEIVDKYDKIMDLQKFS